MTGWSAWNQNWIWSLGLIAITIAIHVVGVGLTAITLERVVAKLVRPGSTYLDNAPVSIAITLGVALLLALLHAIEAMVWAVVYVRLGALPSPADAALYSVDSITTRGSSGLVLERQWRMMGAVEAGDGMLLFGISTGFLFYVMVRVWKRAPW
jgi:hypothetical protein